jgi:uncharacterized membrane protein
MKILLSLSLAAHRAFYHISVDISRRTKWGEKISIARNSSSLYDISAVIDNTFVGTHTRTRLTSNKAEISWMLPQLRAAHFCKINA